MYRISLNHVTVAVFSLCIWGALGGIIQPCGDASKNYECVAKYLNKYSDCTLVGVGISATPHFYSGPITIITPSYKVTEQRRSIYMLGLKAAQLKSFSYDDVTGKAVLTIFIPDLRMDGTSKATFLDPQDKGLSISSKYTIIEKDLTLSTTFNSFRNTNLSYSHTTATSPAKQIFRGGSNFESISNSNERVKKFLAAVGTQADSSTTAQVLTRLFVNYRLCDYDPISD